MTSNEFQWNFQNKSDLIRSVYASNPTATNHTIKKVVKQTFGVDVNSNLIIAAIGRYKNRIALGRGAGNIIQQAKSYLAICLNDLEQAIHFLKKAKAA
jgi:ribosomal protein L23